MKKMIKILKSTLVLIIAISILIPFFTINAKADYKTETLSSNAHKFADSLSTTIKVFRMAVPKTLQIVKKIKDPPELTGRELYEHYVDVIYLVYFRDVKLEGYSFSYPSLIKAQIEHESDFRPNLTGDQGKSKGLMQWQLRYFGDRMAKYGKSDCYDPVTNILVGMDVMTEYIKTTNSVECALMCYNGGAKYGVQNWSRGVVTSYASSIMKRAQEIEDSHYV